jgi:uncharacterized protein
MGVYTVMGNHDRWASVDRTQYWLARSGQDLSNKIKLFERDGQRLWLGGTGDLWTDRQSIDEVFAGVPADECKLVLAHNPGSLQEPFQTGIDLMLSGHTHGGQFRLPVLNQQNPSLPSGLFSTPHAMLFITSGIGYSILPYRFNCPPEISELVLKRAG